jgi:hypothetical protein
MTYRNRMGGGAEQGERASDREALAINVELRYSTMVIPGKP